MDDTHTHTYRKGAERNERYKNICLYLNFDAVKEEKLKNVVIPISSHVFGEYVATLPTLSYKVNCSVAGLLLGLISVTCGNCSESNILDFTISVNCNSCILSF